MDPAYQLINNIQRETNILKRELLSHRGKLKRIVLFRCNTSFHWLVEISEDICVYREYLNRCIMMKDMDIHRIFMEYLVPIRPRDTESERTSKCDILVLEEESIGKRKAGQEPETEYKRKHKTFALQLPVNLGKS